MLDIVKVYQHEKMLEEQENLFQNAKFNVNPKRCIGLTK